MNALRIALKEWAVICRALAEGRQAIILRKGGIAERGGHFHIEHRRFWLYPTYVHQQEKGILEMARPLLDSVREEQPPARTVRLTHFAEVPVVHRVERLDRALGLSALHFLSRETVESRFHYREPGLFVLPLRVYRVPSAHELTETDDYAGCKSWVELTQDLSTDGAVPVLGEEAFDLVLNTLDRLLDATALA